MVTTIGCFKDATFTKREIGYYTPAEFLSYIGSAKKLAQESETKIHSLYEWDFYVFFNIAFYTGMRKGEIFALKWSDINDELISVRRSLSQKVKGGVDVESPPKSKKSIRTLQIPLPLIQVLKEQRERQEKLEHFTEDFRVCGGESCIRDTVVQLRNGKYARLSGQKKIRVHDFRHSHVSVLANEGINIQEIARRLGHAKVEITWNTYSHLYPREQEKAVDVLNRIA